MGAECFSKNKTVKFVRILTDGEMALELHISYICRDVSFAIHKSGLLLPYWKCGNFRIKSLRPSDAYMRQWSNHHWFRYWLVAWSAPSNYLNQYWNIVNWNFGNKLQWNLNRNSHIFIQENAFESVVCEIASILSRPQCVKPSIDSLNMGCCNKIVWCITF